MPKDPYSLIIRNVVGEDIHIKLAPLFLRMQAFFIDFFILLQIQIFVGFIYFRLAYEHSGTDITQSLPGVQVALIILFAFLIQVGYYVSQEYWWKGQTIGKKLLSLRVITTSGGGVSFRSVLIRGLTAIVEVNYFPLIAGFVSLFNPKGQRIGDSIASCYVVFEEPAS